MSQAECTSCGKQHNDLRAYRSKLMIGTTFLMCPTCRAGKMEPRFAIILTGRSQGVDIVSEYVRNRRYCGEEILAKELMV